MVDTVGDVVGFGVVPFVVVGMCIEVGVDFASGGSTPLAEAHGNAAKRLAGADGWIRVGTVTDLFTTDCILLVIELQSRTGDAIDIVQFIQRCIGGAVDAAVDGEVDVSELERLGVRLFGGGVGVFGWSEQPEEADNAEVPDDLVVDAPMGVLEVKDIVKLAEDGDVGRVGTVGGSVFLAHGGHEISE